jgi:hypothetical protein
MVERGRWEAGPRAGALKMLQAAMGRQGRHRIKEPHFRWHRRRRAGTATPAAAQTARQGGSWASAAARTFVRVEELKHSERSAAWPARGEAGWSGGRL